MTRMDLSYRSRREMGRTHIVTRTRVESGLVVPRVSLMGDSDPDRLRSLVVTYY